MVSKNTKSEREQASRIWKHCRLTFLFLLPLSNLFHCFCHVSPSILKHPKQVFFNPIKYIWHLLPLCSTIINSTFSFNVNIYFYSGGSNTNDDDGKQDLVMATLGNSILTMFPGEIDRNEAHPDTFANDASGGPTALAVVLTWEVIRFNKLITVSIKQ